MSKVKKVWRGARGDCQGFMPRDLRAVSKLVLKSLRIFERSWARSAAAVLARSLSVRVRGMKRR